MTALRRLRFYAGNAYRFATIPSHQRVIAPVEASTIFGCSFGDQGWQHLRRTLEEYDRNPGIRPEQTTLHLFLTQFKPSSICDLLEPRLAASCALPLFVYPWGTFRRGETASPKDAARSRFCGPSTPDFVAAEFARVIALYRRMKEQGYRPWQFGHTFIGGTFLVSADDERRFVVLQGNHRLAVLAHLGVDRIAVRDVRGYLAEVRERDIGRWPLVRAGACSSLAARAIFRLFFEQAGWHVAASMQARAAPAESPCASDA
jgi:hypothetical protein